jgi:two-component system LytT family sensor kinase
VPVQDELIATKNLFLLFKEKFGDKISFQIDEKGMKSERLLVPNSLPMLLDCIINSSIISKYQALKVSISFDEDDYLVIQYKENDKLSLDRLIRKRQTNLHEAFAYFSDRPVIQIKAYGDAFVKLPLLQLNE